MTTESPPVAPAGHAERLQLLEQHEREILAVWTFPHSAPLTGDPVVVVAAPSDPFSTQMAEEMRRANITRSAGPVIVGAMGAANLAESLDRVIPALAEKLRRLHRHRLFVVVLAHGGAHAGYFAVDVATGKLRQQNVTSEPPPSEAQRLRIN